MGAGHSHHHHDHGAASFGKAFAIGIALNLGFVVVEAVFGFRANSVALLSDAGHNLSDVLGLFVAWGGGALALKASSDRFTYGLKKASILAALANALFLMVAVGAIGLEAIQRLFHPEPAKGGVIMTLERGNAVDRPLQHPFDRPSDCPGCDQDQDRDQDLGAPIHASQRLG